MLRNQMTHRARFERSAAGVDAYGNALPAVWAVAMAAQPCYYWQPSTGPGEHTGERNYRSYGHQMVIPLGVDVLETDRVNGIVDRRGFTVSADVFNIIAVVRKPDHLLLTLEVIK